MKATRDAILAGLAAALLLALQGNFAAADTRAVAGAIAAVDATRQGVVEIKVNGNYYLIDRATVFHSRPGTSQLSAEQLQPGTRVRLTTDAVNNGLLPHVGQIWVLFD